jgi:photosystem II stability/assembly factor-like uncharacterized protein
VVAAGETVSTHRGTPDKAARRRGRPARLAPRQALFLVRLDGTVTCSGDRGLSWQQAGNIKGQPAAFESAADELYVALRDGTVKRSADGGQSWQVRSRP